MLLDRTSRLFFRREEKIVATMHFGDTPLIDSARRGRTADVATQSEPSAYEQSEPVIWARAAVERRRPARRSVRDIGGSEAWRRSQGGRRVVGVKKEVSES